MVALENEIRNLKQETAYVVDKNGGLHKAEGTAAGVSLESMDLCGAVITHNHPADESGFSDSFGKDDFMVLQAHPEIKELRAVDAKYTYRLRLLKALDLSYQEADHGGMEIALESGNYEEPQHNAMIWLEKEGYIEYERTVSFR